MLVTSALLAGLSLAVTPPPPSLRSMPGPSMPGDDTRAHGRRLAVGAGIAMVPGVVGLATTATLQMHELNAAAHCAGATQGSPHRSCFAAPSPMVMGMRVGGLATLVGSGFLTGYLLGRVRALGDLHVGRRYDASDRKPMVLVTALMVTTSSTVLLAANLGGFAREHACESDACRVHVRTMRYAVTDAAAGGLALGLALGAHTLGRMLEHRRHAQLTLSPNASLHSAGLTLSGRF